VELGATQELRSGDGGSDEQLPRRFDRYELLRKLAMGGMAEIYLAKQSGLEGFEKVVVLKRILGHLATDEEFVSMFLDEARIAAKLSHPNIVQIYDLGKADDTYYIAMEYVSGRNVQHMISKLQQRGEHIPVEHVCRVIAGVCDGLYYAHSRKDYDGAPLNIVHRDISPQNILVSFAGGVKVVDFGIAKASTQIAQTRAGVLKGKYAYMSPEQVRGAKIDHRSDLFAVGLVMYEMITGARAFERDSSLKTLKAIVQEKPLNPRELNPEVPMEVVKLLSKALEKNPDRRYKSAQEMQLAIEDYLESSPKKSNNVRLSRYMYDVFDDELNAVDSTMVVKGIGEVIVPASQAKQVVARVEEDIDHGTLSAALLAERHAADKPDSAKAKAAARKEPSEKIPRAAPEPRMRAEPPPPAPSATPKTDPRPVTKPPTPVTAATVAPKADQRPPAKPAAPVAPATADADAAVDDDDDADGKTMPVYGAESYERERQARGIAPPVALPSVPPPPSEEDEDKTTAGVPPPSGSQRVAARTESSGPVGVHEGDARAAALLAKVDAMAAADAISTKTATPAPSGSISVVTDEKSASLRWDGATAQQLSVGATGTNPNLDADPLAPKESMVVGPNGRVDVVARARPPARPAPQTAVLPDPQTADTPSPGTPIVSPRALRRPAAQRQKPPPIYYAALTATVGLVALSLVGVGLIVYGFGSGPEYGLVVVKTEPLGASVFIDGEDVGPSPAQASVPKKRNFTMLVALKGYTAPALKTLSLEDKELVELPAVVLVKQD
jgi:serine/threonine-protein kinase